MRYRPLFKHVQLYILSLSLFISENVFGRSYIRSFFVLFCFAYHDITKSTPSAMDHTSIYLNCYAFFNHLTSHGIEKCIWKTRANERYLCVGALIVFSV